MAPARVLSGGESLTAARTEFSVVQSLEVLAVVDTLKVLYSGDTLVRSKSTFSSGISSSFVRLQFAYILQCIRSSLEPRESLGPRVAFLELALKGSQVGFKKICRLIDTLVVNLSGGESATAIPAEHHADGDWSVPLPGEAPPLPSFGWSDFEGFDFSAPFLECALLPLDRLESVVAAADGLSRSAVVGAIAVARVKAMPEPLLPQSHSAALLRLQQVKATLQAHMECPMFGPFASVPGDLHRKLDAEIVFRAAQRDSQLLSDLLHKMYSSG